MEEEQSSLKDKSEECLNNFLIGFKEMLKNQNKISKKIR
jgi:hypothetical protein